MNQDKSYFRLFAATQLNLFSVWVNVYVTQFKNTVIFFEKSFLKISEKYLIYYFISVDT